MDSIHLNYTLTRQQRLTAHVRAWMQFRRSLLLIFGVVAVAVILAILKSPWYLLLLVFPPIANNATRFLAGCVNPFIVAPQPMDVMIETDRIGYMRGRERRWLPLEDIFRVERFGDTWAIMSRAGEAIIVPVSVLDESGVAHIRSAGGMGSASG